MVAVHPISLFSQPVAAVVRFEATGTTAENTTAILSDASGLIISAGEIEKIKSSTDIFVLLATVQPQLNTTLASFTPYLFVFGYGLYILLAVWQTGYQYEIRRANYLK